MHKDDGKRLRIAVRLSRASGRALFEMTNRRVRETMSDRRKSKDISRRELITMIAKLRGIVYEVGMQEYLKMYTYDEYQEMVKRLLMETTFDIYEEDGCND